MSKYKAKGIFGAFRNASRGIRLALKSEGNIRIHFVVAILVLFTAYTIKDCFVHFATLHSQRRHRSVSPCLACLSQPNSGSHRLTQLVPFCSCRNDSN